MTTQTIAGFCRCCPAVCSVLVTVEDGVAVKVTGDPDSPLFKGYSCAKGRALPEMHNDGNRLLQCLKADGNGGFSPIGAKDAVAEIGEKLQAIIDRHGPRAIATYWGTGTVACTTGVYMNGAWHQAIKSPMVFTASSIDKPGASIALALHGNWVAGAQSFESSDTWIIVGANPIISRTSSVPSNNPGQHIKDAIKRGMKLIVVDPRRTETAKRAHLHLQSRPGEDPTLLAGILHILMRDGLCDDAFVRENATGFDALKGAVAAYTPDYVAARCGIAEEDLLSAAHTFGKGKRGMVVCATGPSFSTRSNLAFYLALCINTVCGRWARAGDIATYPNALLPAYTPKAQPYPPYPAFGEVPLRAYGLRQNASGMPTAALADEILMEGEGQVKALLCLGGNPLQAWPDQAKALAAMKALDLLVVFDYQMSETAQYADYVIATPLSLEYPGTTQFIESIKYIGVSRGFEGAWAQYTPKMVEPPEGSDLMDEREFFFRLAQHMGLQLSLTNFFGYGQHVESPVETIPLDMTKLPSIDELLETQCARSRIPLAEVKQHPHGLLRTEEQPKVAPRDDDCTAFLQLADPLMMAELAQVRGEDFTARQQDSDYPFTLLCRRDNNFMNSFGQRHRSLNRGRNYNPACLNPGDLEKLGVGEGAIVSIRSRHGEIRALVEADDSLPPGMLSLTHGFGAAEGDGDPRETGSPVTRLIGMDEYDPISGIPRMSALPVNIIPATA